MDQAEKNRRKRWINNFVGTQLSPLGFRKTKPGLFVGAYPNIAAIMHLCFRRNSNDLWIHLGWRVLNDPSTRLALNGLYFSSGARNLHINPNTGRRYQFGFNIIDHKEDEAAKEVVTFF